VNAIAGFCAGIVNQSSTATGNTYDLNAFSDDIVNIMPVPVSPCF
jgi:hypothetical protein